MAARAVERAGPRHGRSRRRWKGAGSSRRRRPSVSRRERSRRTPGRRVDASGGDTASGGWSSCPQAAFGAPSLGIPSCSHSSLSSAAVASFSTGVSFLANASGRPATMCSPFTSRANTTRPLASTVVARYRSVEGDIGSAVLRGAKTVSTHRLHAAGSPSYQFRDRPDARGERTARLSKGTEGVRDALINSL